MATTVNSGPIIIYGGMNYNPTIGAAYNDFNVDAGPSVSYQGDALFDPRMAFSADYIQGRAGVIPSFVNLPYLQSVDQIPAAFAIANIAVAANVVSGVAMTLVSAPSVGVTTGVPIMPYTGSLNGGVPVVAGVVLDFGFAFANCTAASKTITVADSTQFSIGMPLVIANVGNAGGTTALLTWVTGILTATTITSNDAPAATNASVPVGAGNIWTPREGQDALYPTAHMPYMAAGPALMLDPTQAIARGVSITGSAGATGGNVTVAGWDIYWQPMNEVIAVGAGAIVTYGKKAFKAIRTVTSAFTDAHNYSVGTSDVFGFHLRSDKWEYTNIFWAGAFASSSTGWIAFKTPALGDVRGTVQTSATGGGTGIGATASNGTVAALAMSGNRLSIFQSLPLANIIRATPLNSAPMMGAAQT